MTTPYDTFRELLTNLSNDQRRTVSNYVNITPNTGSSQNASRLLSDIGFLTSIQFNYYNAPSAHYTLNIEEDRRDLQKIVIKPYGIVSDLNSLKTTNRVAVYPTDSNYFIPRGYDSKSHSSTKDSQLFNIINDRRRGPAFHFIINRLGDVNVGPALDFEVVCQDSATAISIAMESGAIITQSDFTSRNFERIEELPFTDGQLFSLAVIMAKLKVIYPSMGLYTNINYDYPNVNVIRKNLLQDQDLLTPLVNGQTPYDPATEVFRAPQSTRVSTGRSVARNSLSQVNTMGALSPLLGNYAAIAGAERSSEVAFTQRRELFVTRANTAQRDADTAASLAATSTQAEQLANEDNTEVPATNTGPHSYDFHTGLWGDDGSY